MEKVKIKNIKSGAIEEVKKELAGDYVGTGEWVLVEEKETKIAFNKDEK